MHSVLTLCYPTTKHSIPRETGRLHFFSQKLIRGRTIYTLFKTRLDSSILSTSRTKRWNGTLESLSADFLKAVLAHMESYGDRVQFEFPGHGKSPIYQIIGLSDRKMGFDGKHLLLRLNETGNVADSLSSEFSIDAVRDGIAGKRAPRGNAVARSGNGSTATRVRAAAPKPVTDTIEQDKYAYFRANRDTLPEGIAQYADEISQLMRTGKTASEAFQEVVAQHF